MAKNAEDQVLAYVVVADCEKHVILYITFNDDTTAVLGTEVVKNHYDIFGKKIKRDFYSSPVMAIENVKNIKLEGATLKVIK